MKRNFLSDKLDELYKREIYNHPLQVRPKPDTSITGKKPDDEDIGVTYKDPTDLEKVKKDLGLKGDEKNLGQKKKSTPKDWDFEGPRISIKKDF